MTAKHTPTPWRVVSGNLIKDELMPFDRDERDTALIASADGNATSARAQANAAFIVRACNSHEQLVAALRQIESHLDGRMAHQADNANYPFWNQLWDIASTALAAAGAQP